MTAARPAPRALARERLLPDARALPRVCLLSAPAGYGKTILLRQLEARLGGRGVAGSAREWRRGGGLAEAVASLPRPAYVAVDDAHELDGSRGEEELVELIEAGPEDVTVLVATRVAPNANLSRLAANGELLQVEARDLRFRSWEVEQLYREVYRDPLSPGEVTALARRTRGWAACLQLFHRATAGAGARARADALAGLSGPSGVAGTYLAQNVLDALPAPTRRFLLETSALDVLTPALCDDVLGRAGSGEAIDDLERRGLAERSRDGRTLRCDPLLRTHLAGERAADDHARAAAGLERHGMLREALLAYRRAGERGAVQRLLARLGEDPAGEDDAWSSLASARRLRDDGNAAGAVAAYRRVEGASAGAPAARAAAERRAITVWLEPLERPAPDWSGALRAAMSGESIDGGAGALVAGLAALVEGDAGGASRILGELTADPDATHETGVGARIGLAAARLLAGDDAGAALAEAAAEEAEVFDLPWIVRVARSVLALAGAEQPPRFEDPVGTLLASLLAGLGSLRRGEADRAAFDDSVALSRRLGLRALEAWARAGRALAAVRTGLPAEAAAAEAFARAAGARGPRAYALVALAESTGDRALAATAEALARECGLELPVARDPVVRVRCFGGLAIEVGGRALPLDGIKPRARQVLRLLLLRAPHAVHREVLIDALWPHLRLDRAASSLHVALSALRHALEAVPGLSIERDGDAYALRAGPGVEIDLLAFRRATAGGAGMADARAALGLYAGDVFPEDGPAEWVVEAREQLRERAAHAALFRAEELLDDDPRGAAAVCERGLELDRHLDDLWRLLADAYVVAGLPAAAARAAARYDDVLADLGIEEPVSVR